MAFTKVCVTKKLSHMHKYKIKPSKLVPQNFSASNITYHMEYTICTFDITLVMQTFHNIIT